MQPNFKNTKNFYSRLDYCKYGKYCICLLYIALQYCALFAKSYMYNAYKMMY